MLVGYEERPVGEVQLLQVEDLQAVGLPVKVILGITMLVLVVLVIACRVSSMLRTLVSSGFFLISALRGRRPP